MWPRFGIKIGNSTLCIAYVKSNGKPEVIANKQGDRSSQACLLWSGADEIECGLTAKQKMAARPKQAVANSFQLLLPASELVEEKCAIAQKEIPCEYDTDANVFRLKFTVPDDGKNDVKDCVYEMTAFDVHVHLLRAELELARQYHNDTSQKPCAVLSIPAYYPQSAWGLLANAAENAGFHVAQIIVEPTAALLAYNIGESSTSEAKYVLTIKSGGLFSHFALYIVRNGLYSQISSNGPFSIGGRQYTEALVQFICEEFQRKYKLDPNESRRSMAKIRTAASNCKHILTTLPSTQIYIDSLMDGVDFNAQMSRARFESLIQPVINSFMHTLNESIENFLQQNRIQSIHEIVLLGSTMQIPKLQAAIVARFPEAILHSSIPDEAVAFGSARQASFLVDPSGQELQKTEDLAFVDEDIEIWHGQDDSCAKLLIEKGTLLPFSTRLDIGKDISAEKDEIFHVRVGERIEQIVLNGAFSTDNVFHVETEIHFDKEVNKKLAMRFRCL